MAASQRSPTKCSSWPMTSIRTTAPRVRSLPSNGGRPRFATAVRQIPRDKLIVAIGNYAYDWHDGTGDPENVEEAWVDAGDSDAPPVFDKLTGNSTFAYSDEEGHAAYGLAPRRRERLQRAEHPLPGRNPRVALVAAGAEDPGLWSIFGRTLSGPRNPTGLIHLAQRHERRYREARARSFGSPRFPTARRARLTLGPNGSSPTSTSSRCPAVHDHAHGMASGLSH